MFVKRITCIAAVMAVISASLLLSSCKDEPPRPAAPPVQEQAATPGETPEAAPAEPPEAVADEPQAEAVASAPQFKILYVPSYHMEWEWPLDQFEGFKEALKGVNVEYKVFEMDTKRKSDEEWKQQVGKQAQELTEAWKPDLVYTSDDNAQKYYAVYYLGSPTPFVFSAVNQTPDKYGFDKCKNVAGVLEQEHIPQTIHLLKEILPNAKKLAILTDPDATWPGVIDRMKEFAAEHPDEIEIAGVDTISTFAEYRQKVKDCVGKADAIALLGIFNFRGEDGKNVPWEDVARWTAENGTLPEISFWKDRVYWGALCSVTVSGYEQGLAAGRIARAILVEGKAPSDFAFEPTVKGKPFINLARARKLGIPIKSDILLSAEVLSEFEWEKAK
ncbi:hypothetical protein JW916_05455 [Candidatus Sumerlaeota bacterium]|nr:hypothetical protein [Candidatus Sumerlaeota bacterium]